MDYETFDRLHRQNPLLFSLAMEIFLDKGRTAILKSERDDLTDAILHRLVMLLRETSMQEAVETMTDLARLNTGDLLDYAKRSGYFIGGVGPSSTLDGPF